MSVIGARYGKRAEECDLKLNIAVLLFTSVDGNATQVYSLAFY